MKKDREKQQERFRKQRFLSEKETMRKKKRKVNEIDKAIEDKRKLA